ncbi:MAG: flavin reductase family protein [Candidatus Neomarinimicrobiota bacterium]|jgi:flavin reductase (DIM6/NTAB) family NADH-FMN oxidoreductase RutF|nr:flavin reductase family protein [Candidatus Neomarinimicrobiota bacterium]MDX9780041.1 flavin reductase family protein [bacterium]
MKRKSIDIGELGVNIFRLWEKEWFLLSSGDYRQGNFNAMTVAWGSLGTMWSRPFAQVVVRPSRYTYFFMNRYDTFTLCRFPEKYQKALSYLGSVSGRDVPDKLQIAGLTPEAVPGIAAPAYAEADLLIACRKRYWQDMDETHFLDGDIMSKYPQGNDFHRIYFGEVIRCEIADQQ